MAADSRTNCPLCNRRIIRSGLVPHIYEVHPETEDILHAAIMKTLIKHRKSEGKA